MWNMLFVIWKKPVIKSGCFYKNYQTYLATQRALLLNEILQSLKKVGKKKKKERHFLQGSSFKIYE